MGSISYDKLTSLSEVRLLEVEPADGSSLIICNLRVCSLDDQPFYEALSYTWGNSGAKRTIICNGIEFNTTDNCYNALLRLRYPQQKRILWVDAICIDQTNVLERNQQVQLMRRIYNQANRVLIWLGVEENGSTQAIAMLPKLKEVSLLHEREILLQMMEDEFYPAQKGRSDAPPMRTADNAIQAITNIEVQLKTQTAAVVTARGLILQDGVEREGLPGPSHDAWTELSSLLRRAWFSRVWVLQEVVMSKEALELALAADCLEKTLLPLGPAIGSRMPRMMDNLRQGLRSGQSWDLLRLLLISHGLDCTDIKDKVYGVLGMAPKDPGPWLKIDYALPVLAIFRNTALSILHGKRGFDVLALVRHPKRISGLPSWAPDWTSLIPPDFYILEEKWYSASGNGTSAINIEVSRDCSTITVDGLHCGWVKDISAYIPSPSEAKDLEGDEVLEFAHNITEVATEWRNFAMNCDSALEGMSTYEDQEEAFWRTMVADLDAEGYHPAPRDLYYNYKHFLSKIKFANRGFFDPADAGSEVSKTPGALAIVYGLHDPDFKRFYDLFRKAFGHRLAFLKPAGWLALVPKTTRKDDSLYIFEGAKIPFIVRRRRRQQFEVVGPCFVHGIMNGNLFVQGKKMSRLTKISLV
ncbi:Heterokaryon incompatibility protein 6, OR allele [Lachnellula arida]|uniref:Heterokaryon incompatibility protein 6, OR allele n=1 Tax=Lachnellula arida TaxID=1316785 RepID=A0A8T9BAJ0_9HELO|nr:Heterokaryon incompatibility protein 6, OR allele [Lachnellula arida]